MPLLDQSRAGDTALLRLDRPPVNAIDLELIRALRAVLEAATGAPPAGGLVLTGTGGAFSAGVDVKAVPGYGDIEKIAMVNEINHVVRLLYTLPVPTVAALNGHALGGGLVLALACDWRIAPDADLRLGLTEVTAGVPFPAVAMEIVRAELTPTALRALVLTGQVVAPGAALGLGVVDELVPADTLRERALGRARELAALRGYAAVKRGLRAGIAARLVEAARNDPLRERWV